MISAGFLSVRGLKHLLCWLLLVCPAVSAEMYKCTDADGSIAYEDRPCSTTTEEIIEIQTSRSRTPPGIDPVYEVHEKQSVETPTGQRSSRNSPLARAYVRFLNSLKWCRKTEVLKQVSVKTRQEMEATSASTFKIQCRILKSTARTDFENAIESIEGDTATLKWEEKGERIDGNETFRWSTYETIHLVKENGVWQFGD